MERFSIGVNFPQIIVPEDVNKAGRKTSNSEDGWQCQGQSLKLCHRAEEDTLKVRKDSTSYASLLAPPPRRRRRSSTNSSTGTNNNSSDEGSLTNSDSKIQTKISNGTTKINDGKTAGADKLPKILTEEEKPKNSTTNPKNEKKRKKSQLGKTNTNRRRNQASTVELKKENEEIKYGLDLTRNCIPGLDITRPYTYSYFPKIEEKEKHIQTGGKDSTTSRLIPTRKFLVR